MDGSRGLGPLTPYEAREAALIQDWLNKPPSVAIRGLRSARTAISWVARKVLPDGTVEKVSEHFDAAGSYARRIVPTGAIEGAINANIWLAEQWADESAVLRELGANSFDDLADFDLETLDRAADSIQNWAIGYGGAAGAAAGAGGIWLAVPGIAAVINISMRTIRKIGLCYGYKHVDDLERRFMLEVLSLVGGSDQAAKLASAQALREIQVMVTRRTFRSMAEKAAQDAISKEAFVTSLREIAKRLGVQLTKKRILMSVPAVGGGVGLLLDGNYLRQVGWTARRCYQRRWLQDRGRWPGP